VALATETDGSIVCPAHMNGVVGIKPTVGVTSRAGVVPISHTQDTIGPHARTVADAAAVLTVIASQTFDGRDQATGGVPLGQRGKTRPSLPRDYTQFVNPDGLRGARIGVTRQNVDGADLAVGEVFDDAIAAMGGAGAAIVDLDATFAFPPGDGEFLVLLFEFVDDLRKYFASRVGVPMAGATLADLIAFNNANAATEMPFFGQELFELAAALQPGADTPQPIFASPPDDPDGFSYNEALQMDKEAGNNGIDAAVGTFHLDAIATPTGTPAFTTDVINGDHFEFGTSGLAAIVGYPIVNVPMGQVLGLPVGISFIGPAFSEPALIRVAAGFEHAARARIVPKLFQTLSLDLNGIPLNRTRRSTHRQHDERRRWTPHSM
jgi:amidase